MTRNPDQQVATTDRSVLELAQWAEWKATRRRLLKAGLFTSSAMAFAGFGATRYIAPAASAQDATPKSGGTLSMTLSDDDIQSFDPIPVTDNMSIWTMLLIYDQLIRVAADGVSLGELSPGDRLEIHPTSQKITLLHPDKFEYYRLLRSKLHWGRGGFNQSE